MSLVSINTQIASIQNSLRSTNWKLIQKREELEQLQDTLSNLIGYKQDFEQNEKLCTEPELARYTWHGQLASNFDEVRTDEVLSNYQDISKNQLTEAMDQVQSGIEKIELEIKSLQSETSNLQSRLSYLYELRRAELMNT